MTTFLMLPPPVTYRILVKVVWESIEDVIGLGIRYHESSE